MGKVVIQEDFGLCVRLIDDVREKRIGMWRKPSKLMCVGLR